MNMKYWGLPVGYFSDGIGGWDPNFPWSTSEMHRLITLAERTFTFCLVVLRREETPMSLIECEACLARYQHAHVIA